jgi:hypothetical protein
MGSIVRLPVVVVSAPVEDEDEEEVEVEVEDESVVLVVGSIVVVVVGSRLLIPLSPAIVPPLSVSWPEFVGLQAVTVRSASRDESGLMPPIWGGSRDIQGRPRCRGYPMIAGSRPR